MITVCVRVYVHTSVYIFVCMGVYVCMCVRVRKWDKDKTNSGLKGSKKDSKQKLAYDTVNFAFKLLVAYKVSGACPESFLW